MTPADLSHPRAMTDEMEPDSPAKCQKVSL